MILPNKLFSIAIIFLLTHQIVFSQDAENQGLDFSSIDAFIEIAAILLEDKDPTEEQWGALISSRGYQVLQKHERVYSQNFFKKRFSLVFKPSKSEQLATALKELEQKKSKWALRHLRHYCRVKESFDSLRERVESLKNAPVIEQAKKLAAEYLPANGITGKPEICFLIFDADARGYSPLLFDLVHLDECKDPLRLFAHEFHHYYLNRLWKFHGGDVDPRDMEMVHMINQIYLEGLADQIDKRVAYYGDIANFDEDERALEYRRRVRETPELIKALDDLLVRIAEDPTTRWELGADFADMIPNSGHPTGYFMARTIREEMGEEALIKDIGNPFAFLRMFNESSKKSGGVCFTDKAMIVFEDLENKYVIDRKPADELANTPPGPGIDLTGVDRFFELVSILEKDKEPTESQWEKLFATHGYCKLMEIEKEFFSKEYYFKKYFRLIFKPSEKNNLEAELRGLSKVKHRYGNNQRLRHSYVNHLCKIKDSRKEIQEFVKILRTPSIITQTKEVLSQFLPATAMKNDPRICFLVFGEDYRAGVFPVLMDVLMGMELCDHPARFVARWSGHDYIHRAMKCDLDRLDPKEQAMVNCMARVYRMGVLDRIDAASLYLCENPRPENQRIAQRYKERLDKAPDVIKRLDNILIQIADAPSETEELAREFAAAVPGLGGSTGYHMACLIIQQLGSKALVDVAGNPFAFFRRYHDAAIKKGDGCSCFSEKAMGVIGRLEAKYLNQ